MVRCMALTLAQPTPVNVGPLPVALDVEAAVRHNGGTVVSLAEAEVMIWQDHTGEGFAEWLAAAPSGRWVQLPSAGVDWLFDRSLYRPGIPWTCAKGVFGDAVAELALGLLIAGFRSLGVFARADRWLPEQGRTVHGSHVAILGAGGIATALLERLKPFGVETSVVRRHNRPVALADRVVTMDELPKVLSAADAVVLALPLTPATRHLIGAEELAAMRPDAWLVNVGRGQLVDTSALLEALSDRSIAGAALDVTDPEPLPEGHPLWTMPSVILTPHVGATAPMSAGPFRSLWARTCADGERVNRFSGWWTPMPGTDGLVALGSSGLSITQVGLGAWAMGGPGWAWWWGPQDDDVSVAAIHRAVELGVNWIDTAAEYGLGHSEEVVGRAIAALPPADRPYVFSKCGMVWEPGYSMTEVRPIASLGVDRIDLLQVLWPPASGPPVEVYWAGLVDLRGEGKIRAAGLSNFDVSQLERAEAVGHVDCLEPPFLMIDRAAGADVIPWCFEHDTGVIVYSFSIRGCSPASSVSTVWPHCRSATGGVDPRISRAGSAPTLSWPPEWRRRRRNWGPLRPPLRWRGMGLAGPSSAPGPQVKSTPG